MILVTSKALVHMNVEVYLHYHQAPKSSKQRTLRNPSLNIMLKERQKGKRIISFWQRSDIISLTLLYKLFTLSINF